MEDDKASADETSVLLAESGKKKRLCVDRISPVFIIVFITLCQIVNYFDRVGIRSHRTQFWFVSNREGTSVGCFYANLHDICSAVWISSSVYQGYENYGSWTFIVGSVISLLLTVTHCCCLFIFHLEWRVDGRVSIIIPYHFFVTFNFFFPYSLLCYR